MGIEEAPRVEICERRTGTSVGKYPLVRRGEHETTSQARADVGDYLTASFPWYGLERAFTGPRWLMQLGMSADGSVEHGSLGHGDVPTLKASLPMADLAADIQRFAVVVTLAHRPV